ncbi:hypothetical protein HN695_02310 [Candidatus Woesearchaeota archaeon]|jgi:hypothetical protein|nr:hypothetical protein [Candidatus Woesearchaeota archaeon]MBT5272918.1 hypothetical protein [Candidatus Woesearchaeota archaeon]MBT6337267.1 hypothetical protein [Candidatus Woesearchaeota archaeon]MBT7927144.1 hypothetical protein [Candidatus Woesearchaeota archaeon]
MKKLGIIVMLSILSFLLISCGNSVEPTPVVIPDISNFDMDVYVVESENKAGIMDKYVIEEEVYDNFQAWEEKKKQKEEFEEYEWKIKQWNSEKQGNDYGEYWKEEERIEEYCEENGYLRCMLFTETCLEDGCHKVTVTCEDSVFDPKKLEWDDFNPKYECQDYDIDVTKSVFKKNWECE